MKKLKVFLYPEGKTYFIEELEQKIGFRYVTKNHFEDQKKIYYLGLQAFIKAEQRELGKRYIDLINSAYLSEVFICDLGKTLGYGLFAAETIEKGEYVGEYTGLVRKNNQRYFVPINDYCYIYPIIDKMGCNYVIDGTEGNLTRFINHSYAPNLKPTFAYNAGYFHLIFLSIKKIKKGEQLCYNYGRHYWYIRQPPQPLWNYKGDFYI